MKPKIYYSTKNSIELDILNNDLDDSAEKLVTWSSNNQFHSFCCVLTYNFSVSNSILLYYKNIVRNLQK